MFGIDARPARRNLANNRLGAGALAQLASLNKLAVLALHNNNIHGAIPCSLGSMMELRTLYGKQAASVRAQTHMLRRAPAPCLTIGSMEAFHYPSAWINKRSWRPCMR